MASVDVATAGRVKEAGQVDGASSKFPYPLSPYRFDPWTLNPRTNWIQFTHWFRSLKGEDPFNLIGIFWIIFSPLLALYGLFVTPWHWKTLIFAAVFYVLGAVSITGGYHRLFSHRTYNVGNFVKSIILLVSASCFQGTVLIWARNHRAHHRWMDSERDPYDATKGLWWSHVGWAIQRQKPTEEFSDIDLTDLTEDPVVMFSHNYYGLIALFCGFIFPSLFAGLLWGDYAGGFWIAGVIRIVVWLHCTFLINSMAHYEGDKDYNTEITPVDNLLANLLTLGEGYHNFHHSFPYDFRGSEKRWVVDPPRWMIEFLATFGLATNLKTYPKGYVDFAKTENAKRLLMTKKHKSLDPESDSVPKYIIRPTHDLPAMTVADVQRRATEGAYLIIIDGMVIDVKPFLDDHPGGPTVLKAYLGKDATKAFYGPNINHTMSARIIMTTLAVAKIEDEAS